MMIVSLLAELVPIAPEDFDYLWDAQTSTLPLLHVINVFQVMSEVKISFRNIIERSAPR